MPAPVAGRVEALLEWGDAERRDLPWRRSRDPWEILVSEVMLQQTQVERVVVRFGVFIARFPTPAITAAGSVADVVEEWSGMGYNRRAVNLWRAAGVIVERHGGTVPGSLEHLLALPGVGPYTARAVQAFAFEHDVGVVDTNAGRLLARWSGHRLKPAEAQRLADAHVPAGRAWAWNQTVLDVAAALCTKREPRCDRCPVATTCGWRGRGADPAAGSAGVSGPQSRFEGSARQVRGRIVESLRSGPIAAADIAALGRPDDEPDDIERIVEGLIDDGLVARRGTSIDLVR